MNNLARKSDQAYSRLKEMIEGGELQPGERLAEQKIVQMLDIGRGPIRESLLRLEADGLVESEGAHRSKRVAYFEDMDCEELVAKYQVREMLESLAARLAAENMTGKQINQLRILEEELASCLAIGDRMGRHQASKAFNHFLLANCGNPLLEGIYREARLEPLIARSLKLDEQILRELPGHGHRKSWEAMVVEAIASHNPDEAERCMRLWLQVMTRALLKLAC